MRLKSDIEQYFEDLGYHVGWDYSRKLGESWWEITEPSSNKMIAQIDKDVPITAIVEDLLCLREGKDTTSK